jgi:hypothetical protein
MALLTKMVTGWQVNLKFSPTWQDQLRHSYWCVHQQNLGTAGEKWDCLAPGVYWFDDQEHAVLFQLTWS